MSPLHKQQTRNLKAIIFAAGSDGDIHPHLGLGCELMSRGHHVVFISTPRHVAQASECGFEVLSFLDRGEQQILDRAESVGEVAKIKAGFRFYSHKISMICELAASHIDDRSILIAPPFAYVLAKMLHSKYGVPYVSTAFSPASIHSLKDPASFKGLEWFPRLPYSIRKPLFYGLERLAIDPFVRILLKEAARNMGLPLPRRVFSKWSQSSQRIIGLFYDWFCTKPEDWSDQLLMTGFPLFQPKAGEQQLSAGLSQFLDAGPPPIVFNPGTETKKKHMPFLQPQLK
jgi:rhamnosyltransferase subunit B